MHLFEHDGDGFLTRDTDPAGSFVRLDRNSKLAPTQVTRSTPLGRNTTYQVSWSYAGDVETSAVKDPAGLTTSRVTKADLSSTTTHPEGTVVTVATKPDPRFGMDAFVPSVTVKTPAGLTRTVTQSRTATMASAQEPLTLRTLIEQVTVNGKAYRSTYDGVAKTVTQVTPAGRQAVSTLDTLGRVSQVQLPGVLPVSIQYDLRGRPQTVTQGARTYTYGYDASGRLQSIADPLHSVSLGYDGANRPTGSTLPDQNSISASYDGNGNLLSLTPPGRAAHTFSYQGGDLEQDYTPPSVDANGTGHVLTSYDLDQNVTSVAPDGLASIVPSYDAVNGRLVGLGFSGLWGHHTQPRRASDCHAPSGYAVGASFWGRSWLPPPEDATQHPLEIVDEGIAAERSSGAFMPAKPMRVRGIGAFAEKRRPVSGARKQGRHPDQAVVAAEKMSARAAPRIPSARAARPARTGLSSTYLAAASVYRSSMT